MNPLVSVFCPTYNHAKYIAKCLDGFLLQKTNFDVEFFVQDDASTDSNPQIINEYAKKHDCIIPVLFTENQYSQGKNLNEYFLKNAKGKYLAWCEGDDYWSDPYKLQKQVDFLEANLDYSICFHNVYELCNGRQTITSINKSDHPQTYTIEDLAKKNFIHTPSVVFRNGFLGNFPSWFINSPVGDYVLYMLNAQYGKIIYLPDLMAVYRIHSGGVWSTQSMIVTRKKWTKVLDFLLSENFSESVKNNLRKQKEEHLIANLKDLYFIDEEMFTIELTKFIDDNPRMSYDWLTIHYPELVKKTREKILGSIEFRLGKRIATPLKKVKNFLKYKK